MTIDELIYKAIGACYEVYNALGPGLLESVYEKAMMQELKLRGLSVKSQVPVEIVYKGELVGADLRLDIIPAGLLVNFDVSDFKQGYKVIK